MKRQPAEGEKIFANDATYKGLISKYTNRSYNSTTAEKQTTHLENGKKPLIDISLKTSGQ